MKKPVKVILIILSVLVSIFILFVVLIMILGGSSKSIEGDYDKGVECYKNEQYEDAIGYFTYCIDNANRVEDNEKCFIPYSYYWRGKCYRALFMDEPEYDTVNYYNSFEDTTDAINFCLKV